MNDTFARRAARALRAVARRRCPACAAGRAFVSWWRMGEACAVCGRTFQRHPGSTTGAMQLGSMAVVLFAIGFWLVVHLLTDLPLDVSLIATAAAGAIFGLVFFPYAKLLWEAVDCLIDASEDDGG